METAMKDMTLTSPSSIEQNEDTIVETESDCNKVEPSITDADASEQLLPIVTCPEELPNATGEPSKTLSNQNQKDSQSENKVPTTINEVICDDEMTKEVIEDNVEEVPDIPEPTVYYWEYDIKAPVQPYCIAQSNNLEFQSAQYLKGCKWAPDGSCLLANSDDSTIKLFGFPSNVSEVQDWNTVNSDTIAKDNSWSSSLRIPEGGPVYDYCWYPFASSSDLSTSCFLSTAKDAPIHLWDAYYGTLRATYRAYNNVDESIAAYSVAFDLKGQNIYCGYEKSIRIFNIARPGRECTIRKLNTSPLHDLRQHGIISCIAFNPAWESVYACGSYRKTIGLYMEDGTIISMLEGHVGGITHLLFSRDGTKLYSGARFDSQLFCWDLRNLGTEYKIYDRVVKTQQRIYFDLTTNDRFLFSGGTDGVVRIWDTLEESNEPLTFQASTDCVNGVSINPFVPVIATTSGQRRTYDLIDNSDSSDDEEDIFYTVKNKEKEAHCIELWKF